MVRVLKQTFEKFTSVTVENEEPDTQIEIVKISPQYIPEGYSVESEIDSGIIYRIIYNNQGNNYIEYIQQISFGTIHNVNTEDIEYEDININSLEGIKYVNNGINTVVFADETYMYTIYGKVSFDELIKMAESIKIE